MRVAGSVTFLHGHGVKARVGDGINAARLRRCSAQFPRGIKRAIGATERE